MKNTNINKQTSSNDIVIVEGEVISTSIENSTPCSSNALTVLGNPNDLRVPENTKECLPFIAVCDGILKTAENMLKQLNKEDEQYNAIMKLSWKYAVLRLKTQYNLGKYFADIDGAQGTRSDLINPEEELVSSGEKKLTKEQILKQQYNISVKKAWQHEQLYKKEDLINKVIKRAKKDDDLPTLKLAMTILDEENKKDSEKAKEKQKNQAKHDANQLKLKEKAIKDTIKFQKLHRTNATVLDDETFNVIYANPLSVSIPMASLKEIDIPANENSVLLLWADSSNLLEALEIIASWGFVYKDMCIWNRLVATQTGEFTRNQHNILLFATKGEGLTPDDKSKEASVLSIHSSQKEDVTAYYHDLLETMFPDGAYLDLCDTTAYNSKWKTLSEISTQQSNSKKGE